MSSNDLSFAERSATDLERFRPWVEAETGMDFSGTRLCRLQAALAKILPSVSSSRRIDHLIANAQAKAAFLERLTAELTVGESFFFRNEHHFRALREDVLPDVLSTNLGTGEVRIWSAGCAAGEEPYSLAILVDQLQSGKAAGRVSILGTDLNPLFLERARTGCYRSWSFRQTDIHENQNYFCRRGDTFQIAPKFREQVRFAYLNLVKDVYPSALTGTYGLDLILFRNVAIYLKPEVTAIIIERFHQALRPGGWLLLGEAEVSLAPSRGFEVRRFGQATFHQKSPNSESPGDKFPLSPPVLAGFPFLGGPNPTRGLNPAQAPPAIPEVPALPDWVPLPKKPNAAGKGFQSLDGIRSLDAAADAGLARIERLLSAHEWDAAERAIANLGNKTQQANLRLRLAQELLKHAAMDRVRDLLDQCLKEQPFLIAAHLLRASLYEEAGELQRAEHAYRRALFVDRNSVMAHFHLGLILQQTGDAVGSERSFRTVRKLIAAKNPHDLVECGEGVCFGRLREMLQVVSDG
jgi:chemotaxis protein methyltransferase CheR